MSKKIAKKIFCMAMALLLLAQIVAPQLSIEAMAAGSAVMEVTVGSTTTPYTDFGKGWVAALNSSTTTPTTIKLLADWVAPQKDGIASFYCEDDEGDEFVKLSNGDYIVRGDMTLSDLEDVLDIELTNDEYDTIAGLVISQLDRVPEETEHPVVNYKNLRIKVLKVEENAIAKVLIHINPVAEPEEEGKDEGAKGDE